MAASRSGSLNSLPGAVDAVVAGHVSLDLAPTLQGPVTLEPGRLVVVGPALVSTGGVVCNTGLALHRLGVRVRLTGKVGADLFGRAVLEALLTHDQRLADDIVVAEGEDTSYTIVINPPGFDRSFLHCAGVNRTFCADDVRPERLAGSRVFHFGYPPLMPAMYADGGAELRRVFARVHEAGPATSLDLCAFDPDSAAAKVDWSGVLATALPHVDLFAPSIEEVLFILDRPAHDRLRAGVSLTALVDRARLAELGDMLFGMGAAVVAIKLGQQGLYVRTAADAARTQAFCDRLGLSVDAWCAREVFAPCFEARQVVATTGSGDCTIAGLLAALLRGANPAEAATAATAVGAFSVEAADPTSAIPPWPRVAARIEAGWPRVPVDIELGPEVRAERDATGTLTLSS
jgi:sugar/nucleoside kinase (ribokinase family)